MCTTSTSSKIVEQACRQPSCSGNCSSSPPRMLGAAKKPCFKAAPRSRLPPCKQVALVKQLVRSTVATCPGLAAGTVAKLRRVVSQGGQPEQFVYAQLLEVPGAKQALVGLLDLETSTVEVVLDALALLHNGPCIGGSEDLKDGLVDVGAGGAAESNQRSFQRLHAGCACAASRAHRARRAGHGGTAPGDTAHEDTAPGGAAPGGIFMLQFCPFCCPFC